jgi:hypothetical protein
LDGRPFAAGTEATLVRGGAGRDTLYVHARAPGRDRYREISVSLTIPGFTGAGRYLVGAREARLSRDRGRRRARGRPTRPPADGGTIVVSRYDAASGALAGTVAFTAARSPLYNPGSFGDLVRLEDGRFRATARVAARVAAPAAR